MMQFDRRQLLQIGGAMSASGAFLSACSTTDTMAAIPKVACLLPLTGADAELGRILKAAIEYEALEINLAVTVLDSGSTNEMSLRAAQAAVKEKARLIIGPLYASQIVSIRSQIGPVTPILSFSNNTSEVNAQTVIMGVTPAQTMMAMLRYARRQGVRRIGYVPTDDAWSVRATKAGMSAEQAFGVTLIALELDADVDSMGVDAILIMDWRDRDVIERAIAYRRQGYQILAATNGLDASSDMLNALEGTWFAGANLRTKRGQLVQENIALRTLQAIAQDAARLGHAYISGGVNRLPGRHMGQMGVYIVEPNGMIQRAMRIYGVSAGRIEALATVKADIPNGS